VINVTTVEFVHILFFLHSIFESNLHVSFRAYHHSEEPQLKHSTQPDVTLGYILDTAGLCGPVTASLCDETEHKHVDTLNESTCFLSNGELAKCFF
jgi:hypothetical protein